MRLRCRRSRETRCSPRAPSPSRLLRGDWGERLRRAGGRARRGRLLSGVGRGRAAHSRGALVRRRGLRRALALGGERRVVSGGKLHADRRPRGGEPRHKGGDHAIADPSGPPATPRHEPVRVDAGPFAAIGVEGGRGSAVAPDPWWGAACWAGGAAPPVGSASPGPGESGAGSGGRAALPLLGLRVAPVAPVVPLFDAAPAIAEAPIAIAPSTASVI